MDNEAAVRAIRRLTFAVWCLAIVVAAQLIFILWSYVHALSLRDRVVRNEGPFKGTIGTSIPYSDEGEEFFALPPDQKIRRSSVIVITRNKADGDRLAAMITEIPKQRPGTRFYYKTGQEFFELSRMRKPDEEYGDGDVVFLEGNPATMREAVSYSGDRIGALGQMTLTELRTRAKQ